MFPNTEWTIHEGEQWAILGANGSGKSTLARAICGDPTVSEGEIIYHFANPIPRGGYYDYATPPEDAIAYVSLESHREFVSQYAAYHQARWMSFEDDGVPDVATILRRAGPLPPRARRLMHALDAKKLLRRKVTHLSNGETRKLLLLGALAQRPRLLVLDNPCAGLDIESRDTLRQGIAALMREGQPVLLITQRDDELPETVTHLLRVANGRVMRQEQFTPKAPRKKPAMHTPPIQRAQIAHGENEKILVDIRNASIRYGRTAVLRNINWQIREGERWALLGRNGSGKSTLLSLILADHPQAYSNEVHLFGRRRGTGESIWDIKRKIGWVAPELQYYYPAGTTVLNVVCSGFFDSIGLYRRAAAPKKSVAMDWLDTLGLDGAAFEPFNVLSDSQQRLVLLARALVKHPPLLILDEPCQGLDAPNRTRVLRTIDKIMRRHNGSLIFVTHHPAELPHCITHTLQL